MTMRQITSTVTMTDHNTTNLTTTTPTLTFDWLWVSMTQKTHSCPHTSTKTNSKAHKEGKTDHAYT
eukprot:855319-Heterocapsa_arctica.AAC.1